MVSKIILNQLLLPYGCFVGYLTFCDCVWHLRKLTATNQIGSIMFSLVWLFIDAELPGVLGHMLYCNCNYIASVIISINIQVPNVWLS